jgi:hypothetical protein
LTVPGETDSYPPSKAAAVRHIQARDARGLSVDL